MELSTLNTPTMTSLEIAELTGKLHKNVIRDIRTMFDGLGIDGLKSELTYRDSQNKEQTAFRLDKEMTFTLVTGYNVKIRNAVVKRWMELESGLSAPLTHDPLTFLQGQMEAAFILGLTREEAAPRIVEETYRVTGHDFSYLFQARRPQTKKIRPRRPSPEVKEALHLVDNLGYSLRDASQVTGASKSAIQRWHKK